ncbi:MAG: acyl-CoA thioesterase [Omnitrophica bacterium]|nr:acyl-CoA thioesterase [Candidatus Omnitrophota bacterium]
MKVHETTIRARYEETDRMGVVYYSKYLVWFEVARTEFFRAGGISYAELENEGIRLMVVDARCSYKAPVSYDDLITVKTRILSAKNTSFIFGYEIHSSGRLVSTGETAHVFTNEQWKPIKIPEKVKRIISV